MRPCFRAGLGSLLLLGLAALVGGCEPEQSSPVPALSGLTPERLPAGALATFVVRGENLLPGARVDLDEGTVTTLLESDPFVIRIGSVELASVTWVDAGTLTGVLDTALPVGRHPLEVVTPGGALLRLDDALEVLDSRRPTVTILDPGGADQVHPGETIRVRMRGEDDERLAALELGSCLGDASGCAPLDPLRRDLPAGLTTREEAFDLVVDAAASEGQVLVIEAHAEDGEGNRSTARVRVPVLEAVALDAIAPVEGGEAGGTQVTITGAGFDHLTRFLVGLQSQPATLVAVPAVVDDPTRAIVTMPAGQGSVDLVAERGSATTVLLDAYTYRPGPAIIAVVPPVGRADLDQTVQLQGQRLADAPVEVRADGTLLHPASVAANRVEVVVPAGTPGDATLTVRTLYGEASVTYTRRGAPVITGLEPDGAPEAGGIEVSVLGSGFVGDGSTRIELGGISIQPTALAADRLRFLAPPGVGVQSLRVVSGQHPPSDLHPFPYHPPPCVESLSPDQGPTEGGMTVTLSGRDFTPTTTVSLGGRAVSATYVDEATLQIVTPATTNDGPETLAVASPEGGLGTCTVEYWRNNTPLITNVAPTAVPAGQVTRVTLWGSDFLDPGTTTVTFGGVPGTVVSQEPDRLVVDAPAQPPGSAPITVTSAYQSDGEWLFFTYTSAPVVTALTPADGPTSGGTLVTVTGGGFDSANTYETTLGGTTVTLTYLSPTSLQLTTPPGGPGIADFPLRENGTEVSSLFRGWTYNAAPSCSGIAPGGGPLEGGDTLTLTGTGFRDDATLTVLFGTIPAASTTFVDASHLEVVSPVGVSVGEVAISIESVRHDPGGGCSWYWGAPRLHLASPSAGEALPVGRPIGVVLAATGAGDPIEALRASIDHGAIGASVAVPSLLEAVEVLELTIVPGTAPGTPVKIYPQVLLGGGRLVSGVPLEAVVESSGVQGALALAPASLSLVPGEVAGLELRDLHGDAPPRALAAGDYTWESLGPAVEVSSEGLVRGVLPGSATVIAWDPASGRSAAARIVVEERRTRLAAGDLLLAVGQGFTLSFTDTDASGTVDLSADALTFWASSDPAVATVDAVGAVLALAPGTTTISADYASGTLVASVEVRVGGAGAGEGVSLPAGTHLAGGTLALEGLDLAPGALLRAAGAACLRLELGAGGLTLPVGARIDTTSEPGILAEGSGWLPPTGGAGGAGLAAGGAGGDGSDGAGASDGLGASAGLGGS
ncbi:MAG: IPT/TIG domain-containing protein, partial [Deltaproteobacteria bacterium]|nr:IPT/TIG domain-containing protein [Deltaproteobacteria bacterium]